MDMNMNTAATQVAICEALGLTAQHVRELRLVMTAEEPIIVYAQVFVTDEAGKKIADALGQVKLREVVLKPALRTDESS